MAARVNNFREVLFKLLCIGIVQNVAYFVVLKFDDCWSETCIFFFFYDSIGARSKVGVEF